MLVKRTSDNSVETFKRKTFDTTNATILKGIAIILMMFHHVFRNVSLFKGYDVSFGPFPEWFVVNLCYSFKICVSLFVFITGYGLYISYKANKQSISKWVIKREIKMLSGFWFIVVLSSIICELANGRTSEIYFNEGIIYGIFKWFISLFGLSNLFGTYQLNGTWWYMSAAVIFIMVIPIFSYYEEKFGPVIALSSIVVVPRVLGISYTGGNSAYAFILILCIGIIFAKYDLLNKWINYTNTTLVQKLIKFLGELCLCIFAFLLYRLVPEKEFYEVRFALIPLIIILFSVEYINYIPLVRQVLYFLGKHSMNIFLVHTFIIAIYYRDFVYSFHYFIVIVSILLGISLAISILVEALKKVVRYDDLINKVITKLVD